MANVVIRYLSERTIARLKDRATRNNRSLQAELRLIVERAAVMDMADSRSVAARIRRKLSNAPGLIGQDVAGSNPHVASSIRRSRTTGLR
jgi:plasmid stability protein